MGTTVQNVAPETSPSASTPGKNARLLILVGALLISCLLCWSGRWSLVLLSELLAAVAGTSMGWISVRGSKFGRDFFDLRAKPLKDQIDRLKEVPESNKDAAKNAVFDERILEPEYAIGQGLISRDEYNDFRNGFLAQSELSLGLVLPLILVVFAEAKDFLHVWSRLVWASGFIFLATWFLFVVAMERRQKYRIELKLLLVSRWDKQAAADKAAKDAKAKAADKTQEDTVRKVVKEELKDLHLEVKPLVVEVRKSSEEPPEEKHKSSA
jgi:hypothetical protein